MRRRTVTARAALGLLAALGTLAMAEVALRLVDSRGSPVDFMRRNDPEGWGADGIASLAESRGRRLVLDPDLLWRLAPELDGLGRNTETGSDDLVIAAIGDGNTWGSPGASDGWPALLEYLADLNETPRRIRALNAGVPGYSSLQGLRRFQEVLGHRPALVYVAFGANEAHRVRLSDAECARRAEALKPWAWSRLAWAAASWARDLAWTSEKRPRVSLEEYEGHLKQLVALARARGVTPVLVTHPSRGAPPLAEYNEGTRRVAAETGVACVDAAKAFDGEPALFEDSTRLNQAGRARMAEILLGPLRDAGFIRTAYLRSPELDLRTAGDERPELESGWFPREIIDGSTGRWTRQEASLSLERRQSEEGLVLDCTCPNREKGTSGRVEVNGETVGRIDCSKGRSWRRLDIGRVEGDRLSVRILVDTPFAPPGSEGTTPGQERGVFVHGVRLAPSNRPLELAGNGGIYGAGVDLSEADDGRTELGAGWWPRETWTDGRRGRWTGHEAWLHLERPGREAGLLMDVTLENPAGETGCRVEVNGRPAYAFRSRNGRHRYGIDIGGEPARELAVRFVVDRTFVPKEHGRAADARRLGIFVHRVWLAPSPVP